MQIPELERVHLGTAILKRRLDMFGNARSYCKAAQIAPQTLKKIEAGEPVSFATLRKAILALWPESTGDWRQVIGSDIPIANSGPPRGLGFPDATNFARMNRYLVSELDVELIRSGMSRSEMAMYLGVKEGILDDYLDGKMLVPAVVVIAFCQIITTNVYRVVANAYIRARQDD